MGYQDRDWYREHHAPGSARNTRAPARPPRIRHMLSPWTRFWARVVLAVLALAVLLPALRWLKHALGAGG